MNSTVPFSLYDAFSDVSFGGSQGAVISCSKELTLAEKQQIAKELGTPATAFVSKSTQHKVSAQFMSTVMELPMCGHGTICLMTRMIEDGTIDWNGANKIDVELDLPKGTAIVEIFQRNDGRPLIMLDIAPPAFQKAQIDGDELAALLGIDKSGFEQSLPIEIASADFIHLIVPTRNLSVMRNITPDFNGLIKFCHKHDLETIAVFCTEVEQPGYDLHVRDFCPAVGVAESAAAGTTNGALSSYLIRHQIVHQDDKGLVIIEAEQGHEINRPSSIRSIISIENDCISRLQVGGVATKVIDGQLHISAKN